MNVSRSYLAIFVFLVCSTSALATDCSVPDNWARYAMPKSQSLLLKSPWPGTELRLMNLRDCTTQTLIEFDKIKADSYLDTVSISPDEDLLAVAVWDFPTPGQRRWPVQIAKFEISTRKFQVILQSWDEYMTPYFAGDSRHLVVNYYGPGRGYFGKVIDLNTLKDSTYPVADMYFDGSYDADRIYFKRGHPSDPEPHSYNKLTNSFE